MSESFKAIDPANVVRQITFGQAEALVFQNRAAMAIAAANAIAAAMRRAAGMKSSFRMVFAAAPSQSEVLNALTTIPNLPWDQVVAFHMDDYLDLPPEAPSFITRVCGFGFHILRRQFEQARRVRSPQISQALGALQRVFGCPEMSAV